MTTHQLYLPCLIIDISHYAVKCGRVPLQDVTERVYMAVVHILVCVGGEFRRLMLTTTPLVEGCIKLNRHITIQITVKKKPFLPLWQPRPPSQLALPCAISHHDLDEPGSGDQNVQQKK